MTTPWRQLGRRAERESLQPELGRGIRCSVAFMAPLLLALTGRLPLELVFTALAAQGIALVDVRGAYSLRLSLLFAMSAILALAAGFGALAAHPVAAAVAATGVVAIGTGLWRHLNSDYGPSLAATSSLIFFIAVLEPGGPSAALSHGLAAFAGGLWGVLLQVAPWPFRPQHPLRQIVAETWTAAADLFAASAPASAGAGNPAESAARSAALAERESALRTAVDKASAGLAGAAAGRPSPLSPKLAELNLVASRLAQRVMALPTALESVPDAGMRAELEPALQPVFTALTNLGRTVALAVVSRQPGHMATVEVRLRRVANLLRGLQSRAAFPSAPAAQAHLADILHKIEEYLPKIGEALRAVTARADERAAFPLELFDLQTLTLRPLAAALNTGPRIDPALVRFTARIAVLTMAAVFLVVWHPLPHGYWLPFTLVVVLQPDYGSTRQKAAQRLTGTLVGSVVASLLLWLHLPFAALMAATAAMSFCFGYWLKRNYGLAVVFVTLFIVLLTEASGPATLALTGERLGSTLAGGSLALCAALLFWPVWERDRFPPILAAALRGNRAYLRALAQRLAAGQPYDAGAVRAKRGAERANSEVFSSLQRMSGDPKNRREKIAHAAALANGNQRLTRLLNLIALHLAPGAPITHPALGTFAERAAAALEALADSVENPEFDPAAIARARAALDELRLPLAETAAAPAQHWIFSQLARGTTELSAMLSGFAASR